MKSASLTVKNTKQKKQKGGESLWRIMRGATSQSHVSAGAVVRVPSTERVSLGHILFNLSYGGTIHDTVRLSPSA
jgi:hypothetical protein